MKHRLEINRVITAVFSAQSFLLIFSTLTLRGQQSDAVSLKNPAESRTNSFEIANATDSYSIPIPVKPYFPKEESYSTTDFARNSFTQYNNHQRAVDFNQSRWINDSETKFGENNAIYLCTEFDMGNYFGGNISLNYIHNRKYSFKIGYSEYVRKPKSQPEDYTHSAIGVLFRGFTDPLDQFNSYQISIGRIYDINNDNTIRINMSVGLGYTVIKEPENWEKKMNQGLLEDNYTWNYKENNRISIIINPKVEYPFSRIYGLTFSPMLQISKDRIYYGIGVGQIIGLLRERKD